MSSLVKFLLTKSKPVVAASSFVALFTLRNAFICTMGVGVVLVLLICKVKQKLFLFLEICFKNFVEIQSDWKTKKEKTSTKLISIHLIQIKFKSINRFSFFIFFFFKKSIILTYFFFFFFSQKQQILKTILKHARPDLTNAVEEASLTKQDKDGGMPSRTSCLFLFYSTYITRLLMTQDLISIGFVIPLLAIMYVYVGAVLAVRLQYKFHTLPQMIVGVILGLAFAIGWFQFSQDFLNPIVSNFIQQHQPQRSFDLTSF